MFRSSLQVCLALAMLPVGNATAGQPCANFSGEDTLTNVGMKQEPGKPLKFLAKRPVSHPAPSSPGGVVAGAGWCVASKCAQWDPLTNYTTCEKWAPQPCTWGNGGTILAAGNFNKFADAPIDPDSWKGFTGKIWLTIGGQYVGSSGGENKCLDVDFQMAAAKQIGAVGFNFDMEGCLAGKVSEVKTFVKSVKEKSPGAYTFCYVPQGGALTPPTYNSSWEMFNYVAPMQYSNDTSYTSDYPPDDHHLGAYIKSWVTAGWKPSMTFITYQSASAAAAPNALKYLLDITAGHNSGISTEPFAGILGWPNKTSVDTSNQKIVTATLSN